MATHKLMDGDLQVFKRTGRKHWQCAASIGGRQYRASTKEESLGLAKEIAKDWYLEKTGKSRAGLLRTEKTVKDAAEKFTREYEVITEGERSPKWVAAAATIHPQPPPTRGPEDPSNMLVPFMPADLLPKNWTILN